MDNFVEHIVTRKKGVAYTLKFIGVLLAAIILIGIFIINTLIENPIMFFGAALIIYLVWFAISSFTVEYEYIITNNEFDIDKITGKQKRKRLITLKLNKTLEFAPFKNDISNDVSLTVDAQDDRGVNLWYLLSDHEKYGKTLLLFTPSERILLAINNAVPYSAKNKEILKLKNLYEEEIDPQKLAIEAILNPIAMRISKNSTQHNKEE